MYLAILCAFAGLMSISASSLSENADKVVAAEADELAMWLSDKMSEARLEDAVLKILVSKDPSGNAVLLMTWLSNPSRQSEKYTSSSVVIRNEEASSYSFTYDGRWQTMTLAMMFSVRPLPGRKAAMRIVTVSGAGYVRVRKN